MSSVITENSKYSYNNSKRTNSVIDDNDNLIKLRLKKPKKWNWELTTSKSSPNIHFPKIQLYDEVNNELLAEVDDADCIVKGNGKPSKKLLDTNYENKIENESRKLKTTSTNSLSVKSDSKQYNNNLLHKNCSGCDDTLQIVHVRSKSLQEPTTQNENSLPKIKERKAKRTLSSNLDETSDLINDFINQLKANGIDYKITKTTQRSSSGGSGSAGSKGVNTGLNRKCDSGNITMKNREFNDEHSDNVLLNKDNLAATQQINEKTDKRKRKASRHSFSSGGSSGGKSTNYLTEQFLANVVEEDKMKDEEFPITIYSEKGLLHRDMNAKEFDKLKNKKKSISEEFLKVVNNETKPNSWRWGGIGGFPIQKSKSAADVQPTEKKKFHRNHTSDSMRFSTSILERISEFKRRSSSSDSADIDLINNKNINEINSNEMLEAQTNLEHNPKYSLRTSKAGTLIVCEESFRQRKVRRRPRSWSREKSGEVDIGCAASATTTAIYKPEKIKQTFEYIGSPDLTKNKHKKSFVMNEHAIARQENDNKSKKNRKNSPTMSTTTTSDNRYEKAIANIDSLITKIISIKEEKHQGPSPLKSSIVKKFYDDDDNGKISSKNRTSLSTDANLKENDPARNEIDLSAIESENSKLNNFTPVDGGYNYYSEDEYFRRQKRKIKYKSKQRRTQHQKDDIKSKQYHKENALNVDFDKNKSKKTNTNSTLVFNKDNKSESVVNGPSGVSVISHNEKAQKLNYPNRKQRTRTRRMRRSVSADSSCDDRSRTKRYSSSSSSSSASDNDNKCFVSCDQSENNQRGRARHRDDRKYRKENGDQLVAIKSLPIADITSTSRLINTTNNNNNGNIVNTNNCNNKNNQTTSDEVLLRFVRTLASLQQHPQRTNTLPELNIQRSERCSLRRSHSPQDKLNKFKQQSYENNENEKLFSVVDTPADKLNLLINNNNHNNNNENKFITNGELNNNNNNDDNVNVINVCCDLKKCTANNLSSNNNIIISDKNELNNVISKLQQITLNNDNQYICEKNQSICDDNVKTGEIKNNINKNLNQTELLINNMGSNVSRHSGKGLSGRRTQSSGNLCNGKHQPVAQTTVTTSTHNNENNHNDVNQINRCDRVDCDGSNCCDNIVYNLNTTLPRHLVDDDNDSTITQTIVGNTTIDDVDGENESICAATKIMMAPLCVVSKKDRNKFCGSLPNHLDADDACYPSEEFLQNTINMTAEYVTVAPKKQQLQQQQQQFLEQQHQLQLQHHQQLLQLQQGSPHNSSSGKGSSTSTLTNLGSSTFKTNHDNKPDLQLKLPLHRVNFDTGCDQGYGSERSPEDEMPPPLPLLRDGAYEQLIQHQQQQQQQQQQQIQQQQPPSIWNYEKPNTFEYDFITKDCIFTVQIAKGPRGLGLSVSGGSDSTAAFPGLIRIKRLFPHQAAWSTGMLQPGDIILDANGIQLTGLTNYDALEVLRTTPNNVMLTICRPRDEQYRKLSPPTEPPKPPQRTSLQHQQNYGQYPHLVLYQQQQQQQPLYITQINPGDLPLEPLSPIQTNFSGEFEIIMTKQQGSLGFTLRKEDESVLGHYVRALVREPATTDGRIKPGDKIVAVNDYPLSPMTHEQAVIFLRQAADTVKLRLYRDGAQTPVAALSPTNPENKDICSPGRSKTYLRPEAINLLSDLAYRKQTPGDSTSSSFRSNNTSPRRLRRGNNRNNTTAATSQSETESSDSKVSSKYIVSSQTISTCSDSDASTISQCSYIVQTPGQASASGTLEKNPNDCYREDELFQMVDDDSYYDDDDDDRPNRPNFLDLAGQSGSTPMSSRKPRFQFSVAANSYELNNLDNEALDAPIYTISTNNNNNNPNQPNMLTIIQQHDNNNQEFTSLPCETLLIACKTESDLKNMDPSQIGQLEHQFLHKQPMYQSAHVQLTTNKGGITSGTDSSNICGQQPLDENKKEGSKSLLKWKGVTFSPDDEENETPGADSNSCGATIGTNPTPGTDRDMDFNGFTTDAEGHKIFTVELNKGWNSRLGFSLQQNEIDNNTKQTIISAIYSDSVAAKDGRLKVGDQIIMVNEESVEHLSTNEIIDLLRIVRGSICVTIIRRD